MDASGRIALPGGERLSFVPITRAAKPLIQRAVARLSPVSSRRRFFTPRFRLSDAELDALTCVDGYVRYAFGICAQRADGGVEGVAAARFVRDAPAASTAEIALTVIDDYQGLGLGRLMLGRLAAAAIELGVVRLRALIVSDNAPVLALLRKYAPGARFVFDGEMYRADIPALAVAQALSGVR